MMRARTITVPGSDGTRREVRAGPTPVAGLLVNEDPQLPGHWVVTHERSGYAVAAMPDPEGALHAAVQLGTLGDWDCPADALSAELEEAWKAWVEETGFTSIYRHPKRQDGVA